MSQWISPELAAVLLSGFVTVIGALVTWMVAWLRLKTKQLSILAEQTKQMAIENHALLEKNTELSENIQRQTDGITKKMVAIAEVVAFTKGQIKGRKEGEGTEPYDELDRLEDMYSKISDSDFAELARFKKK